jgi:hypothetical protein
VAQQGGYRKPNNPAPVSGPGSLSRRTDGGPTQPATYISGLPYGQGQETYNNQVAAPMAGNPIPKTNLNLGNMADIIPLDAPTRRAAEPVTSGIDLGAGSNFASLNLPSSEPTLLSILNNIAQYDPSGDSELIYRMLEDRGY